jgi:serine/threonine protein kinase/Tfp pilus assembly protein PilF
MKARAPELEPDSFLPSGGALRGRLWEQLSAEVDLRSALPPGSRLGSYAVVKEIGRGGMGAVYLAERADGQFQQTVALKVLKPGMETEEVLRRFAQERQILASLQHASIARLYDGGVTDDGRPYLVMEHVLGLPIDAFCDQRQLPVEERLELFVKVGEAVQQAHRGLVVHRDLKPTNILVTASSEVKLLDFGIAKLIDPGAGLETVSATRTTARVMTPEYASPEQVRGEAVTTASDIYQLGLLLYELLTGLRARRLRDRSLAELERAVSNTLPTSPSAALRAGVAVDDAGNGAWSPVTAGRLRRTSPERLRKRLRGDLDMIVLKALRQEPERRYATVERMVEDVRRHLAGLPIRARPDTLAYRTGKFVRRHGRGVAAAGVAALVIVALVSFYTFRLAAERDRARREADKAARVSELLTSLFTGADPYGDREKGEPTLRGLLDAGVERTRQELAGQPETQAELFTVLGRVYERLGLHDKARPLLEDALAIGRRSAGAGRLAQSLNDLGVLRRNQGDWRGAAALLDEALAMRRRLFGNEHQDVAVTLVELARVYDDQGSSERAETLHREALAIRRKVLGGEHRETATSLNDLGVLLWERGDLEGAEPLLRQSHAINKKALGPEHANVASNLGNLALLLEDKGEHAAAEALFREALALDRRTLGEKHPSTVIVLNNLAHPLREQGKYAEATASLEEALRITRSTLGHEHPRVATFLANLARVHLARRRPSAAEPLLRQALRMRRRGLPESDWRVGVTKSLLGAALTGLSRYPEAERLLIEAHATLAPLEGAGGHKGREARAAAVHLAALYEAWGRPQGTAISAAASR